MNIQTWQATFEATLARALLFELAISLIVLIALFFAAYLVTKAAIRDGIRESGILQTLTVRHTRPDPETRLGDTRPSPLPDMRAER
jgi:hypothetical protein